MLTSGQLRMTDKSNESSGKNTCHSRKLHKVQGFSRGRSSKKNLQSKPCNLFVARPPPPAHLPAPEEYPSTGVFQHGPCVKHKMDRKSAPIIPRYPWALGFSAPILESTSALNNSQNAKSMAQRHAGKPWESYHLPCVCSRNCIPATLEIAATC